MPCFLRKPSTFALIDDMGSETVGCEIDVHVMRLWKVWRGITVTSIEMVLADRVGSRIHASITEDLAGIFQESICEGMAFVIGNFTVVRNSDVLRTTPNLLKIVFRGTTRIAPSDGFPESLVDRYFEEFSSILSGNSQQDLLIDVIGQIVAVGAPVEILRKGSLETQLEFIIRDLTGRCLTCIFLGSCNESIVAYIDEHITTDVICVMRLVRVDRCRGVSCVTNVIHATQVFLDPPDELFEDFRSLLPNDRLVITRDLSKLSSTAYTGLWQDEFFTMHPRRTVKGIVESKEVGKCVTIANVQTVDSVADWSYLKCNICDMIVNLDDSVLDCDKVPIPFDCMRCGAGVYDVITRFKLLLVVSDDSGVEARFLISDDLVSSLFAPTIEGLFDGYGQDGSRVLPAALLAVIGKELLFKIDITADNTSSRSSTFKVDIVTDDDLMIDQFRECTLSQGVVLSYNDDYSEN